MLCALESSGAAGSVAHKRFPGNPPRRLVDMFRFQPSIRFTSLPAGVDEDGRLLHLAEEGLVAHALGVGCEGTGHDHEVALRDQGVQWYCGARRQGEVERRDSNESVLMPWVAFG